MRESGDVLPHRAIAFRAAVGLVEPVSPRWLSQISGLPDITGVAITSPRAARGEAGDGTGCSARAETPNANGQHGEPCRTPTAAHLASRSA